MVNISVSGSQITQRLPEQFRFFFGLNMPDEQVSAAALPGACSGVIIDATKGYVITSAHVVHEDGRNQGQPKDGRVCSQEDRGNGPDIACCNIG